MANQIVDPLKEQVDEAVRHWSVGPGFLTNAISHIDVAIDACVKDLAKKKAEYDGVAAKVPASLGQQAAIFATLNWDFRGDPRVALARTIDALKVLKKDAEAKRTELMGGE